MRMSPSLIQTFFLILPLIRYSVHTPDSDMVGSHHEFGVGKNLPVPFVWESNPDDLFRLTVVVLKVKILRQCISSVFGFSVSRGMVRVCYRMI